uniref:hypothetical protein n=1 Tax=Cupriavidus ulmosensis TaxID=3065913 RepID=UPI003F8765D2
MLTETGAIYPLAPNAQMIGARKWREQQEPVVNGVLWCADGLLSGLLGLLGRLRLWG